MNAKTVRTARKRALRVARLCRLVLEKHDKEEYSYFGSALTGELRRASLDLTRALADMRRSS